MPSEIHLYSCDICFSPRATYMEAQECERAHDDDEDEDDDAC